MTEQEAAFAALEKHQAELTTLHAHAARLGDAQLIADLDAHHVSLQDTYTAYLAERGWEAEAATANRSGGEDKPPREDGVS